MHPRTQSLSVLAFAALTGGVRADVKITELHAAPNERFLRWDATGQPRTGTGDAWFDVNFDASSWATGNTPMGFGFTSPATNLNAAMFGKTPTLYVRRVFNVSAANAAAVTNLRLNIDYNDG